MAEIAVLVAIEALKKTSSIVGDQVVKEGSRLSRLQKEISWIEREMGYIQSYLQDVEHKQGKNARVATLIRDIRGLAFDVEDTMEKYFPILLKREGLLKRITHVFSDYDCAHNFLVEVEAIKVRIENITRARQTYGINEQSSDQASSVERAGCDERRSFPRVFYSESESKLILTSGNRDVGGGSTFFEPLVERDRKQLFEAYLGTVQTENDPPDLKEIGDKILRRCGGVPLAIAVVSGLLKLRVRSIDAWKGVLEQMDQDQDKNEFSKTFALSYLDLPTYLKPCFLYFGIFPEGQEIDTFDLINLWAAERFIKGSRVREVEDVGDDYLNQLIARNLIEVVHKDPDQTVKSCRIHDILRSLCIHVAKDINFFIGYEDLPHFNNEAVRRVTTHGMNLSGHISINCQTPNLRSFLCFTNEIWPIWNFLEDLNLVRVLYLGKDFRWPRDEFWSLKNLTYLKLQFRVEGLLPRDRRVEIPKSIIIMKSLVTLDIESSSGGIFIFPMVIWNMQQLRHLLLRIKVDEVRCTYKGFDRNIIPFQNFRTLELPYEMFDADWLHKLSKVRTLSFIDTIREVRGSQEKIIKLILSSKLALDTVLILVLNKLKTLKLANPNRSRYGDRLPVTALSMVGYQNLSNLFLEHFDIEQWPQPDELPQNLTKIILVSCKLKEDPFVVMKKIPKLRVLKLLNWEYGLGELVCTGEIGNFPQLEQLVIQSQWAGYEITIEDGGMPRLKEFILPQRNHRLNLPTRIRQILRQR